MFHIGYSNYISKDKVLGIVKADTAPFRRMRENLADRDMVIDCTRKNKTLSGILLENGYLILSAFKTETLSERFKE